MYRLYYTVKLFGIRSKTLYTLLKIFVDKFLLESEIHQFLEKQAVLLVYKNHKTLYKITFRDLAWYT